MKLWAFSVLLAGAAIAETALADEYYAVTPSFPTTGSVIISTGTTATVSPSC